MTYPAPDTLRYHYSNSTLVFFKAACQANPGAEKFLKGLIHKLLNTFF